MDPNLNEREIINGTAGNDTNQIHKTNKMTRLSKDQALNCPRCNSLNTKFCYYNNYSLSQPRYFCKACRRYWTHGGSMRDVPVGGGTRKNKRSGLSSSSPSSAVHPPPQLSSSAAENYMKHFSPITFPPSDLSLSNFSTVTSPSPTVASGSTDRASVSSYKGLSLMMMGQSNYMQDLAFSSGGFHSTLPAGLFKPATTTPSFTFMDVSLQARNDSADTDAGGFNNIAAYHGNLQLGLQEGKARDLFPACYSKQPAPSSDRATGDHHQQFEQKRGILSGEVDVPGTDFWNQGLLLGSCTSWMNGSQIH
ncbi:hypothetical protein SAY86_023631 [Trapa natans]|uniref:Dof zinc finger protein n=1 Tax=Trapa natans TaxID=22666 RepID=A0AAN7LUU0_TRANT|nr:hypothetical protein SAY86_023631 [Trapa natans]